MPIPPLILGAMVANDVYQQSFNTDDLQAYKDCMEANNFVARCKKEQPEGYKKCVDMFGRDVCEKVKY